ncbi:AI-2E family transporter [Haloferax mediterranei ATCC 33500]|nr:AI-2E family transporter [Haloferax mediterranei]AHZ23891.1 HtlA [Haloferax mediterranei ATCC 33500]ELZ98316.1 putative permease [Haloferax mediterranei ATCC 33500]MDX5986711.1 AI-2E family transporter [Haloferax mediterranei ATCC 33500]QCQ76664.1 AI-2E family transporter [Haloferax mediterranei ATCC 33500]
MWWALALVLAGAFTFVVYSFIGTFVFGLFIYYATRPIYRRIRRRIRPPSLAAAVALFALALPALGLVTYAATIALREFLKYADRLSTNNGVIDLEAYGIDPKLLEGIASPQALLEYDFGSLLTPDAISSLFDSLSVAANTFAFLGVGAIHLFVMIAFAFYLLRDDHRLSRWGRSMFSDDHGILEAYVRAVDRDFNNIFFGNILNAVLTGTIGVIAYSLLNVLAPTGVEIPAPALVGLLAGVASLIPVVGMKLVYVPVTGYMGLEATLANPPGLWFVLLFAAVSFVIVDTIPDLVLRPYVSGRSLHVGAVMIAYTFGPLLFGWYGIFLLPMVLVLLVNFVRLVLPELLAGKPIRPYMVDPVHLVDSPTAEETTPSPVTDEPSEEERMDRSADDDLDAPEFSDRDETRPSRDSRSPSDTGLDG